MFGLCSRVLNKEIYFTTMVTNGKQCLSVVDLRFRTSVGSCTISINDVLKGLSLLYYFLICVIRFDQKNKEIKHKSNM